MSYFNNILDEHEHILKSNGYDEKSLNGPDREGTLLKALRYNLSYAIKDSILDDTPHNFSLKTVGFFNEDKDMVIYTLDYVFNPKMNALDITKLTLFDGYTRREMPLTKSSELPAATEGFKLIKDQVKVLKHRNANYIVVTQSDAAKRHNR